MGVKMAYNRNTAYDYDYDYDFISYEAAEEIAPLAPIEEEVIVETPVEQPREQRRSEKFVRSRAMQKAAKREKTLFMVKAFTLGIIVTAIVAAIIQGQVQLTEINQQISIATKALSEQESINTQLTMKIDSKYSPTVVEEYARENLGMTKADEYQKEYIKISEGDRAVVTQSSSSNIFEEIVNWFSSLG